MTDIGFILAEDRALKNRLSSLYVSDDRNETRTLGVFYRWPARETERVYPFATIELLDIVPANDRQHSERNYYYFEGGAGDIDYYPSELDQAGMDAEIADNATNPISIEQVVPVNLIYQVTTYTRTHLHDSQLTALMLRRIFPWKRGFLEVEADGTMRRCDLLSWQASDVLDREAGYGKRIFRKVYTLAVTAEIPQSDIDKLYAVSEVSGTLTDADNPNDPSFTEAF